MCTNNFTSNNNIFDKIKTNIISKLIQEINFFLIRYDDSLNISTYGLNSIEIFKIFEYKLRFNF